MRFAVSIPQADQGSFDADGVRDFLRRAEELELESAWVVEQVIGPKPLLAPLELLAWAAGCTERIRLGVGVLVSTLHNPVQLAASITAVDRLSHGRLDVGVAAGGGFRPFKAFGVDPETFVARFNEGLQLMKAAWSDEPRITFHGRFADVDNLPIQPKPVQRPHPPIWFGASAPQALARAARHGDAFLGAGSTSTAAFAGQVRVLRGRLLAQGRDSESFRIGKRVYLCVGDDADLARRRVLDGLGRMYGRMRGIEDVSVSGTPSQVADGLQAVVDAGADLVVLNPLGLDVAEDREQLERLAADVLPLLS